MAPCLVSCIMPTADRRPFVAAAIEIFLRQDYEPRELVILDDGAVAISDLVPPDPRLRYVRVDPGLSLGAKRNRACELARGEIIAHWDDDDWYPPDRIRRQVEALGSPALQVCGSSRLYFRELGGRAWEYTYLKNSRPWVAGSTLAYRRGAWERQPFRAVQVGEDSHFVWSWEERDVVDLADPGLCVAAIHPGNTSAKRPIGAYWKPVDAALVERLITEASRRPAAPSERPSRGRALVALAAGIGDVIRTTPLIRVLHRLDYRVDVLLAADYPETVELLRGAPEIGTLRTASDEVRSIAYDLVCSTFWAQGGGVGADVTGKARLGFDRGSWLREGDSRSVERIARELGWEEPMPPPFVIPARRDFQLPPGTVGLHPGCKRGWPWKKWHGFAELAERLEHVVVIGTAEDEDVAGTYFGQPFRWPSHVVNYMDCLSLAETAALIQQCAALVCNDSGMQHVGAAVGTPTYPIYGITNPEREIIPLPTVRPVSKGLSCEPECRRQAWGRRDCQHHLQCLKTMTAQEVLDRVEGDGLALRERIDATASSTRGRYPPLPTEVITIAVRIDGGIGDVLLASPMLEALFDALVRCEIDVFYSHPDAASFVFSSARFVRGVHHSNLLGRHESRYDLVLRTLQFVRYTVNDPGKVQRVCPDFADRLRECAQRFDSIRGLADRHPALDGLWARISVGAGRNVLDSVGHLGGVPVTRDTPFYLAPDPGAYPVLGQVGEFGTRYVTIHDGFDNSAPIPAGGATKCWPIEHWQQLCAELKQRHPDVNVVQLGARKSRRIPGVDLSLVDRTTLHEAAWVLKNALVHIDTDSGLAHVARALHVPAIVLFGPTDSQYYGHGCHTNVAAPACGNCWWSTPDWLARCPRGLDVPECMQSIRPEMVLGHAVARLTERPPPAARAERVSLYDGVPRGRDRQTFEAVCAELHLPPLPISQHIQNPQSGVYIHASKQWEYLYALRAIERFGADAEQLRIADLGGGRGALAPFLALQGHDVEVFDIDYLWDHGGDTAVETRFRRWASTIPFRPRFGSLYNVPAEAASYDVVTCISVVEHVPHKEYVLKEALRIVRPGGILVLTFDFATTPERFEDGLRPEIFSPDRLIGTLGRLGIEVTAPSADLVDQSALTIQRDGVRGIPDGMTVGGIVLHR